MTVKWASFRQLEWYRGSELSSLSETEVFLFIRTIVCSYLEEKYEDCFFDFGLS